MKFTLTIVIFGLASCGALHLAQREDLQGFIPIPRNNLTVDPTIIPIPRAGDWQTATLRPSVALILASTNYPNAYPGGEDDKLMIYSPYGTIIDVVCQDINVEVTNGCQKDAMYFSPSGRTDFGDAVGLCGKGSYSLSSTTNRLAFRFVSNYPVSYYKTDPVRFYCRVSYRQAPTTTAVPPATTAVPTTAAPSTTTTAAAPTTSAPKANSTCTCGARNEVKHCSRL